MRTKGHRGPQSGFLLIAVALLLVLVAGIIASVMMDATAARSQRTGTDQQIRLSSLQDALAAYVTANRRLPCPADGSLPSSNAQTGVELRDGAGICTSTTALIANQTTGIIPWKTLGLKEEEARSADLTYFTYRVFSGPTGFTVDNGANMSACDTDNGLTPDVPLSGSGQCTDAAHNSTSTQFVANKGLTVITDGGPATAAYVLIHHGANGAGAYLSGGVRKTLPLPSVTKEYANTLGTDGATYTATFYGTTPNTSVPDTNVAYFDDRVAFSTITDLAKKAGLAARNWPESGNIFDASTLAGAGFNLAQPSQAFGTVTIGGITYTAASGPFITVDSTTSTTGIGVGTAIGSRSISGSDRLELAIAAPIMKFSIILSQLGKKTSGTSDGKFEAATLELKDSSGVLVGTVSLPSCGTTTDDSSNAIAFDNVTVGLPFSTVVLKPGIPGNLTVATDVDTDFYLNGIAPCAAGAVTCIPTGANYTQSCPFTP